MWICHLIFYTIHVCMYMYINDGNYNVGFILIKNKRKFQTRNGWSPETAEEWDAAEKVTVPGDGGVFTSQEWVTVN